MARRTIAPIIPANEQEHRIYHGNIALANIDVTSNLGEVVLNAYHDREPLGMGREKVVYPLIERTGQAIAFYMNYGGENGQISSDRLKQNYYRARLMHLLLPDNIPDAHFVGSDPPRMHVDMVTSRPVEDRKFERLHRNLSTKAEGFRCIFRPETK